jgi:hypothetical protein
MPLRVQNIRGAIGRSRDHFEVGLTQLKLIASLHGSKDEAAD